MLSVQCQTIGASMGLKQACPNRGDNTCQVSCQDPNKSNQCILLSSLLIDGSSCGMMRLHIGITFLTVIFSQATGGLALRVNAKLPDS
jgi:hypothetical protein